jgi:hypothetical protein
MADLTDNGSSWVSAIFQLEVTTPALAGPGGVMNLQAQQLADRTAWLKTQVENRLPLGGGTMTGFVTLHAAPTASGHAATKGYVDTGLAGRLPLTGGTMTGFVTLHAAPTASGHAATKGYVDAGDATNASAAAAAQSAADAKLPLAGGTLSGDLTVAKANPLLALQRNAGDQVCRIQGQESGGVLLWTLDLGNAAENCVLSRYDAGGNFVAAAMTVNWMTGATSFTSTLETPGARLQGNGLGVQTLGHYTDGGFTIARIGSANPNWGTITVDAAHNPGQGWAGILINVSSLASYSLRQDGNAYAPVAWVGLSDRRLKAEREPITGALAGMEAIPPYTYTRTDVTNLDGSHPRRAGVLAQDVQAVLPEAVMAAGPPPASDPEGGPTLGLDQGALLALTIGALRELHAKVRALESRIAHLETTT